MKILDAVHTEGCNIRITFLKGSKKEIKDVNLEDFLNNHANKHVKKMADPSKGYDKMKGFLEKTEDLEN